MNCKYCGASLPSQGGHCPECGRMIPISQMKDMKAMLNPSLNQYHNKDTAFYKKETAYNGDAKIGKIVMIVITIIILFVIVAIAK